MSELSPKALADAVSISPSYASMILSGERKLPIPLAISIYRATGEKMGPLAGQTDQDIEAAARLHGLAA